MKLSKNKAFAGIMSLVMAGSSFLPGVKALPRVESKNSFKEKVTKFVKTHVSPNAASILSTAALTFSVIDLLVHIGNNNSTSKRIDGITDDVKNNKDSIKTLNNKVNAYEQSSGELAKNVSTLDGSMKKFEKDQKDKYTRFSREMRNNYGTLHDEYKDLLDKITNGTNNGQFDLKAFKSINGYNIISMIACEVYDAVKQLVEPHNNESRSLMDYFTFKGKNQKKTYYYSKCKDYESSIVTSILKSIGDITKQYVNCNTVCSTVTYDKFYEGTDLLAIANAFNGGYRNVKITNGVFSKLSCRIRLLESSNIITEDEILSCVKNLFEILIRNYVSNKCLIGKDKFLSYFKLDIPENVFEFNNQPTKQ